MFIIEKMWIIFCVVITFHSVHTNTVYDFVGSTVTFKCPYVQEDYAKVVWKGPYGGQTVYAHSNHRNTHLPSDLYNRLFIISNSSFGRYNLQINNLQHSDEGEYRCSVTYNETTKTKTFNLSLPALLQSLTPSYYRHLKLDPSSKKLIVGHMNYVSIVDILDIPRFPVNYTHIQFPSEANKLNYCTLSKEKIPYCQNHIRVLEFRTDDTVILCGTNADSPTGFELNITDNSYISLGSVPCANDPFDNFTTTYIRDQNQYDKGTMYYGTTLRTEATIFRPIYDSDGRVREYQKGVISSNWMKDPQFVGSFSLKESVLFFFRETATEIDPSEHKVYSRVAKVCKSDTGGNSILRNKWTSYQKARLKCFTEGHSPVYFDDIQDIVEKDGIFYGLFTTRIKSPVSVICAFNTSDIEAVFNGPFKTQVTPNSFWTEAKNIPQPRPGMCINDSMSQSEDVLNFIANHPLMHTSVQPLYGKPIFVLHDHLQTLEIHKNMTEIVLYAGSRSGKVYKLFSTNENTYVSNIYSPLPQNEAIWSLVSFGDFLLIGTDYSVRQINVTNCEPYITIEQCINDPHCAWVDTVCCSKKYVPLNHNANGIQVYYYDNISSTDPLPYMYRPKMPKWLRVIHTFETKLLIEWMSEFSGAKSRVFVLEFRKYDEMYWKSVEVNETDKQSDLQSFELTNLNGSQKYNIRIFSKNSFGRSHLSKLLTVSTACFDENTVKDIDQQTSVTTVDINDATTRSDGESQPTEKITECVKTITECSKTYPNGEWSINNLVVTLAVILAVLLALITMMVIIVIIRRKKITKYGYAITNPSGKKNTAYSEEEEMGVIKSSKSLDNEQNSDHKKKSKKSDEIPVINVTDNTSSQESEKSDEQNSDHKINSTKSEEMTAINETDNTSSQESEKSDEQNSDLKINLKKSEEMPDSINVADTTSCHKGEERGEFDYIEILISY
ncbi:uncharacterized protein LOC143071659 [Mytilus galloprovincialis]|uniref:uncharacterized protein LOC143071659 n=1 Tax=Mytilus galloprovincialis TaxID=29158 RepID=UPI003F7C8F7A